MSGTSLVVAEGSELAVARAVCCCEAFVTISAVFEENKVEEAEAALAEEDGKSSAAVVVEGNDAAC